jgi:hypothetical protein
MVVTPFRHKYFLVFRAPKIGKREENSWNQTLGPRVLIGRISPMGRVAANNGRRKAWASGLANPGDEFGVFPTPNPVKHRRPP